MRAIVFGICTAFAVASPTFAQATDTSAAPWSAAERARIGVQLDAALAQAPTLHGAHVGIVVRDARDGTVLYAKNPDDYLRPASTMKLLTGSYALGVLGADDRFRSTLSLRGERSGDRFVGSIRLDGGSNPFLTTADLQDAANTIVARGIRHFTDRVTIDSAADRDADPYRDGWTVDDFAYAYAPPIAPLIVDENAVSLTLPAGSTTVTMVPDLSMVRSTCARAPIAFTIAPVESVRVLRCGAIDVRAPRAEREMHWHLANPDPFAYAHATLVARMRDLGALPDAASPGTDGMDDAAALPAETIWHVDSPPLAETLRRCFFPSDNVIAEMLLQRAIRRDARRAGADDGPFAAERMWANAALGLQLTDDRIADGSGMSQYDRLSARELATILAFAWNAPARATIFDALPVAGVSGTLADQYLGTPIVGRAHAKSGSLSHANNLAGYLETNAHGTVIFAFMVDDWVGDPDALLALRGTLLGRFVTAP